MVRFDVVHYQAGSPETSQVNDYECEALPRVGDTFIDEAADIHGTVFAVIFSWEARPRAPTIEVRVR